MGVKGLTSFVEQQQHLLWEFQLHDTKVIIDGYGCMFYLYSAHFDHGHHGGEYKAYEDKCKLFLTNLRECNISPYFVFDGAYDLDDKKLSTLKDRCKERIRLAGNIVRGQSGYIMPGLAQYVLQKALKDLAIPYVVCNFEADNEIVALANVWNCPVLGRDSDFFVMDIKAGYLQLEMLDWKNIRKVKSKPRKRSVTPERPLQPVNYLSVSKYTLTKFCEFFRVKRELVPLLATISGNDYVDSVCINPFLFELYQRPKKGKNTAKRHGHLYSVLDWLADQDKMENCLQKILRSLKMDQRSKVRQVLETSLMMYQPSDTSKLDKFFNEKYISSCEAFTGAKIAMLPWCLASFRQGNVPSAIVNAMCTQRVFSMIQLENHAKPTTNDTSLRLRQIMYGILLRESVEGLSAQSCQASGPKERKKEQVIEYDRKDGHVKCNEIDPVYDVPNFGKVLKFCDMPKTDESTRCRLLIAALGVNKIESNVIPNCFHLPAFIAIYWLLHANPKANANHLRALLLCWVHSIAKQKHSDITSSCHSASAVQNNSGLSRILPDWHKNEVHAVLKNFKVIVELKMKSYSLDINAAHGFAQMQSCLKSTFHLNAALLEPFPMPDVTLLYSGRLVHGLFGIMKDIPSFDDYQRWLQCNLFHNAPSALVLYNALYGFITSQAPSMSVTVMPPKKCKRQRTQVGRGRSGSHPVHHRNDREEETLGNFAMGNKFGALKVEELEIDETDY